MNTVYLHFFSTPYKELQDQFIGTTEILDVNKLNYPRARRLDERLEIYKFNGTSFKLVAFREQLDVFNHTWDEWVFISDS